MEQETYLIGALSKRAAVTPRTIRHYESLGLISALDRGGNGFHRYGSETLARLQKIAALKQLGFDLSEISEVLDLYFADPKGVQAKRAVLSILERHRQGTQRKISDLERFRGEIDSHIIRIGQWLLDNER